MVRRKSRRRSKKRALTLIILIVAIEIITDMVFIGIGYLIGR